ncbi:MAG: alpha/beta hydrolase [Anaerolineales bacterium]
MSIRFKTILTNGIHLHTALAGPEGGEPVFLLHGFPDAWFGWEAQIEPLAEAGFRVIAPDQRGYNLSDKPKGVSSYQMDILGDDILGLADVFGYNRFHLAGHDFGAMVGWNLAMRHPQRLQRLAIANVPHPVVMRNYLRTHPSQMLKSWYAFFFQLPGLPERVVKANSWKFLISAMPDELNAKERARYREAWAQPHAITSMINWYRASLRQMRKSTGTSQIRVPTLVLWGQQDPHISYEMAQLSVDLCESGRLVTFEDATHWVMHDKPKEVSDLLVDHFRHQGDYLSRIK